MSELDLSEFLKEGSLADLSWIDVDDSEYRALDTLPKQNLDIAPDLEALWSHEDRPGATLVPNRDAPKTMLDVAEAHGKQASENMATLAKVARYALMQSSDPAKFQQSLRERFDMNALRQGRDVIKAALEERGLLGRYYVDSADFPGCHNSAKSVVGFVRRFASEAPFVKAKDECHSCIHAQKAASGGTNCAVFHKQIVIDVPYSDQLAARVEQSQKSKGYMVEASTDGPKKRVKLAMLAPSAATTALTELKPIVNPEQFLRPVAGIQEVVSRHRDLTAQRTVAHVAIGQAIQEGRLTTDEAREAYNIVQAAGDESQIQTLVARVNELKAIGQKTYEGAVMTAHTGGNALEVTAGLTRREVVKTASRYMNEGLYGSELLEALKKRFDKRDLIASSGDLRKVIAEQGLQGVHYVDPTVYSDYGKGCHEAERLHRARIVPYVKLGSACGTCVHNREARCSKINKPLVVEPPYMDKAAQQAAILSSGPSTVVGYDQLVNNGLSMMEEFELQKQAADITLDAEYVSEGYSVDFGTGEIKL